METIKKAERIQVMLITIFILIFFGALTFFFTNRTNKDVDRTGCNGFTIIDDSKVISDIDVMEVRDDKTGVHYYINASYYTGFMTPVYDSDGNVKITE